MKTSNGKSHYFGVFYRNSRYGSKIKNDNLHQENWQLEAPRRVVETNFQFLTAHGVFNVERNEEFQAVGYPTEDHYDASVTVQGYGTPLTPVPLPFR